MANIPPWLALILAIPFMLGIKGRWNISLAAWLGPIFLLLFVRSQLPLPGIAIAIGIAAVAFFISWKGIVPLPFFAYAVFILILAVVFALPFLADRLFAQYFPGFWSTLVFPVTLVFLEMLIARLSPYGSWGSLAYTQYGNLPIMQTASVAGIYGVAFLVGWFGSTLAWAWGLGFSPQALTGMAIYAAFLSLVLLAGGMRLVLAPRDTPTVRAALVTEADLPEERSFFRAAQIFLGNEALDDARWAEIRKTTNAMQDSLLSLSEREAMAGAKIIVWAELAGLVVAEEEAVFLQRATALATRHQLYLALPLGTVHRASRKLENKLVMITPDGRIAWQYHKTRPVPGPEASHTIRGDSTPRTIDTPYGRLGALICFDGDFPHLFKPFKKAGVDILLLPASDWKAIDPIHSQMAIFRGVEVGASVLRPARAGLSIASDPYGRVIASQDYFSTTDRTLVAYVPTRGKH